MRRAWLILFVVMALVVLASPAGAGVVYNERYSDSIAEGGWSLGEWGDETLTSGYMAARQAKGAAMAELYFYESVGTLVTCDAGTPEIPDDDFMGYEWAGREGWGYGTLTVGKSFGSASATGTVEAWTYHYSECDWYGGEMVEPENGNGDPGSYTTVEVSLSLTGDGPRVTSSGSYSFHIPGEYNERGRSRSVYRNATGSATFDGMMATMQWGQIGEYSWSSHMNGK